MVRFIDIETRYKYAHTHKYVYIYIHREREREREMSYVNIKMYNKPRKLSLAMKTADTVHTYVHVFLLVLYLQKYNFLFSKLVWLYNTS